MAKPMQPYIIRYRVVVDKVNFLYAYNESDALHAFHNGESLNLPDETETLDVQINKIEVVNNLA